jgi:thioredoxin reductase (NADPH)
MSMTQSSTTGSTYTTDVAIIGAGPVGLFAIFELGMLKIKAHVIDTLPALGGQCTALYPEKPIYDIPGFPQVEAQELIKHLEVQAAPFNPTYHLGQQVTKLVRLETGDWRLETSAGNTITCKAVIIAAGCGAFGPNRPPLADIEHYEGTSVHYMVTKREDFRDAEIVIAGGGDSAVDWANSLADVAKKIYFVHRRDKFRAAPESVSKMETIAKTGKIEFVVPYQLDSLEGAGGKLSAVNVKSMDGVTRNIAAQHLLAFFGPIAEWGLNLDSKHIKIDSGTAQTSAAGIFAIGDIATYPHKLKLILCGFAEAAQAAHAIRDIIYPDVAYHFEYSTTQGVPA